MTDKISNWEQSLYDSELQQPLPSKFKEIYPHQRQAIDEIIDAYERGVRVVFLDAPTGSGKTLIGEIVGRVLNNGGLTPYVCTTKTLQDQILADFPYARILKGRSNYTTLNGPAGVTAADCLKRKDVFRCESCPPHYPGSNYPYHCEFCHPTSACPYQQAKSLALSPGLTVLNMAYFLAEANYVGAFSGQPFVIVDEADHLTDEIKNILEISISPRMRKWLDIKTVPKKTIPESWQEWLEHDVLPAISEKQAELKQLALDVATTVMHQRQRKQLDNLYQKVFQLLSSGDIESGWVLTGYTKGGDLRRHTLVWKKKYIDSHAREFLWRHGNRWLLMTASLISGQQEARELGLSPEEYEVVSIPSTFPATNRPIRLIDQPPFLSYSNKEETIPQAVERVVEIVNSYPSQRILVHTVSYHLTEQVLEGIGSRAISYSDASGRTDALDTYIATPGAVLVAPSFERGIDLPDDLCRVQIIVKVPSPNLGDSVVASIFNDPGSRGKVWYARQTVRSLVQMTGRGVRHRDDYCDTYVIDGNILRLLRRSENLFPSWWKEALIIDKHRPSSLPLIEAMENRVERKLGLDG